MGYCRLIIRDAPLSEQLLQIVKELRTKLVSDAVLAERQVFFK